MQSRSLYIDWRLIPQLVSLSLYKSSIIQSSIHQYIFMFMFTYSLDASSSYAESKLKWCSSMYLVRSTFYLSIFGLHYFASFTTIWFYDLTSIMSGSFFWISLLLNGLFLTITFILGWFSILIINYKLSNNLNHLYSIHYYIQTHRHISYLWL